MSVIYQTTLQIYFSYILYENIKGERKPPKVLRL